MSRDILWTDRSASTATGGQATAPFEADGVAFDSREVSNSDLFVALAGRTTDGHRHVGQAFENGAAAAMVDHEPEGAPPSSPLLLVIDTSEGLDSLARAARRRTDARIAAVTGSVGKTGTKEMLRRVLEGQGPTHAGDKSYNNHVGTPLSLARMPQATRFGIFEIGTTAPGEIRPLACLVRPHVALVTTVEPVHLGNFHDENAIVEEKAAIFGGLEEGGVAIVNADNRHAAALARHAERCGAADIVRFGASGRADFRLIDWTPTACGSRVSVSAAGIRYDYDLGLHGRHLALNSVAVLAAVQALGGDAGEAAAAFASIRPLPGRGTRHEIAVSGGTALVIDESYNASPVAVTAALEVLARTPTGAGGRRIAILGDMAELGHAAADAHAGLADAVRDAAQRVFTVGPLMDHLVDRLSLGYRGGSARDARAMAVLMTGHLRPGDVVLVKGSRRMGLDAVVDALRGSDRAIARRAGG